MANGSIEKPWGGSLLKMCCLSRDDSMSSGPLTTVGAGIYETGAAPKVGYLNESDGAAPPTQVGMFSGVRSECRLSLLNSLRTRRGVSLMNRLERRGGLFLDSASTLFFGGVRSRSEELSEDNSSSVAASLPSNRIGSFPLFCLIGGAGSPLPRTFSIRSPSKRACRWSFSYCSWPTRLCNSAIYLACSSCFASMSWSQRRNWSSRD